MVEYLKLDDPNPEHKKTTFPYVEPTVQLPDEIEDRQKRIDDDFTDLLSKITKVIESVIKDLIPNNH